MRKVTVQTLIDNGVLVINDGHRMKSSELQDTPGLPFIRGGDVADGRIDFSEPDYIDEGLRDDFGNKVSQPNDVVITTKGSVGRFAYVRESYPEFVYSPQLSFWRVKDESTVLSDYLWQWVRSPAFSHQLGMYKGQTTMADYISLEDQRRIDVSLPPLPIQRRIADILGALDDKIALNRQMNETLEAMAQALYRHWFVDFGPFQDQPFVDSELGPIPEGWHAGSLDEIAKNVRGTIDPDELPDSTPYIGLGEMPKGSIQLDTWDVAAEAGSRKRSFEKGQILFGKLRPYFKKVGIAPVDGICSTDMLVLEPTASHFRSMALCQLIQDEFIDYTDRASTGTRMPRISWKRMRDYDVAIPPESIAELYESKVGSWLDLIVANIHESRALAEIRDYLLPKLISGEIEVEAVEERVESAAA